MRRLSMKNKRRKSDTMSESGSEENGVQRTSDGEANDKKENEAEASSAEGAQMKTPTTRRGQAKKRVSRGRHSLKAQSEEPVDGAQDGGNDLKEEQENGNARSSTNKRRKREEQKAASTSQTNKTNSEQEYEVEKIVGHRTIKGRRQFLVRWKGYDEDADTWEQEKDLNCPKLIEDFLTEEGEDSEENVPGKSSSRLSKTKLPRSDKKNKRVRNSTKDEENDVKGSEEKDQKEYEVERIIEVHFKKNKSREFLIRWKGFTALDDTWEPEENLNCPDLINKFMQKLEKAKSSGVRELRTNPAHTKRYTLTTNDSGRRLSRRNKDKQRATYHECDG